MATHYTLPSIIHRGQKQDGAKVEGRQVEKTEKEWANDCKPMGVIREEGREGTGRLWLRCLSLSAVTVTMQLRSAERWGGCCPPQWAALSQAASKTPHCHHHLPGQPSPPFHCPDTGMHWSLLSWWGTRLPRPCRAAQRLGRQAKLLLQL